MEPGGAEGGGVKNFSVGICDGATLTSALVDVVIVTGCMDFKCKLPH